jgi:hypothetical protein
MGMVRRVSLAWNPYCQMKITTHGSSRHRPFSIAAVALFASLFACSTKFPVPPDCRPFWQQIEVAHTPFVNALSIIDGETYQLKVRLEYESQIQRYLPRWIEISHSSEHFMVPEVLFRSVYGVSTTTHIVKLDKHHVGFFLSCGDGEHARDLLFRINTRDYSVRREDWGINDSLEAVGEYQSLERVRQDLVTDKWLCAPN